MTLPVITITMALCFAVAVLTLVVKHTRQTKCLEAKIRDLERENNHAKIQSLKFKELTNRLRVLEANQQEAQAAAHSSRATYKTLFHVQDSGGYEISSEWLVVREVCLYGRTYNTLIKAFTDEDDDFNRREAEELAEKLNEK